MSAGAEPSGALAPVSVVVSTYDRSSLLPGLIEGLRHQTHPDPEFIIIDNGSADDTLEVLTALAAGDHRFQVLRIEENRGPARARNVGWRASDRPLIAFTDDDCIPDPGWLEELVVAAEGAEVVQGRTIPLREREDEPRDWFERTQRIESWSGRYETCNLLVQRRWLERLDGFDERFHSAMGEDVDLGLRAVDAGARTTFAPSAVVRHYVWEAGFRGFLQHRRRHANGVELIAKNPAARQLLVLRLTPRLAHLLVLALLPVTVAAVVLGHPWIPVVAVLGWSVMNAIRTRRRPFSFGRRFGYSLAQFVGYAYETWCFLVSSVRYRTLVV